MVKINEHIGQNYSECIKSFEKLETDYSNKIIKFDSIEEFGNYLQLDEIIKNEYGSYENILKNLK